MSRTKIESWREIEEACLARADRDFLLKPVECAAELALDAPASRGEPADDQREGDEHADVDEILALEGKLVKRRSEEIVDAEGARDNGDYAPVLARHTRLRRRSR